MKWKVLVSLDMETWTLYAAGLTFAQMKDTMIWLRVARAKIAIKGTADV